VIVSKFADRAGRIGCKLSGFFTDGTGGTGGKLSGFLSYIFGSIAG
jgi:hypothetical protein